MIRLAELVRLPGTSAPDVREFLELEGGPGHWSVVHIAVTPDPCPGAVLGWCIEGLETGLTDEIPRPGAPWREFRVTRDLPDREFQQHDVLQVTIETVRLRRRGTPQLADPRAAWQALELAGYLRFVHEITTAR